MLDEFTMKLVDRLLKNYTIKKIPSEIRNEVKLSYKFRGNTVTLVEERISFKGDQWVHRDLAQFRLDKDTKQWVVFWKNSKDKWLEHP
ncbi:MAG: hypothetical protein K0R67_2690, partial [Paenibacillus sp.]|nr:hypothetical protein [Paenibacillus sp.]